MKTCTFHPHSSPETAAVCYSKWVMKRLDRRLGPYPPKLTVWKQVKCEPPETVMLGNIEIVYFYKGVPK